MRLSASLRYIWIGRASIATVSESATVILAIRNHDELVSSIGDRFLNGRPSLTRWRDGECRVYLPRDIAPYCAGRDQTRPNDS
jgi:hypothetical protein